MNKYIYSAKNNAFYPSELKLEYELAGTWPDDGLAVSEEIFIEFSGTEPEGKVRSSLNGLPCWASIPALTTEELVKVAEFNKQNILNEANAYINVQQWPSKLTLGRLSDEDKVKFNLWLDYIDVIHVIDTSLAPDITWPKNPNE